MSTFILEVPEGDYDCEVLDITTIIDEKNRKKMTWDLRIATGPYKSQAIKKHFYLVKASVADFLKKELKILGIEAKDSEDFEVKKINIIGKRIVITATVNDQGHPAYYVKGWSKTLNESPGETKDIGW